MKPVVDFKEPKKDNPQQTVGVKCAVCDKSLSYTYKDGSIKTFFALSIGGEGDYNEDYANHLKQLYGKYNFRKQHLICAECFLKKIGVKAL